MRGEYKTPGGKLVSAELEVVDDRLADVRISGDFFLEPDSALETIQSALNGMPVDADTRQLADTINDRLGPEVMMIGFDPVTVAIAVRRALGKASSWFDHTFDVIPPKTMAPVMHVALDQVIAGEMAAGRRNPTLRFWDWDSSLVVIGSFQSFRNEIDADGAARHGIGVTRRISGGGAMFMEPGNCITYSLTVPGSLVEGLGFEQSYQFLDAWVIDALGEIGVKARYVPLNDIVSDAGKIAGAAQKRFGNGVVVHHATMAYDIDADKMMEVLRVGREKMVDKGIKSANKRVDPLKSQTQLPRPQIIDSFMNHFRQRYDTQLSDYTESELKAAQELSDTKFGTEEWTKRVP